MKISVVIPCKDDQQFLSDCIQSVINQTRKPLAVVVVDDGSTVPIARKDFPPTWSGFPIFLVRNSRPLGLASARNMGVTLAASDWFVPLDSDDMLTPNALSTYESVVLKWPDTDIVHSGVEYFGEGVKPYEDLTKPIPLNSDKLRHQNTAHPTALISVKLWEALGGYTELGDSTHRGYEDWDFWVRALRHGAESRLVHDALLKYRVREGSKLSTQDLDSARSEMIVRNRLTWGCHEMAADHLRKLRENWKVAKVKP